MAMWGGRFGAETDKELAKFSESISYDRRLYPYDIAGSKAHVKMLGATGIIPVATAKAIEDGLEEILHLIQDGKFTFKQELEDIHMNIESALIDKLGPEGARLHSARSRNDQVALDLRMYLIEKINGIQESLGKLESVLCYKAEEYASAVMPGYTHLQRAQPITFGHHLMAYAEMFLRDMDRLRDVQRRTKVSPLGSGALAGTTYPLDRDMVAGLLGFDAPTANSLDGVADRDFVLELLSALSILMVHLSRFAEEIILWCSWEFKFVELDDAFSTGSSIMPQKKNPDIAELVRGKSGRVFGDLMTILTVMKGLPLAYNKDMQEDKEAAFDAIDTVWMCLSAFTPMIATMRARTDNMRKAAAMGFINATDCSDYLVGKGIPFRDAYKIVGQLVAECIAQNTTLEMLPLDEYKKVCSEFDEGIYEAISLDKCVADRIVYGGPSPSCVLAQVERVRELIKK